MNTNPSGKNDDNMNLAGFVDKEQLNQYSNAHQSIGSSFSRNARDIPNRVLSAPIAPMGSTGMVLFCLPARAVAPRLPNESGAPRRRVRQVLTCHGYPQSEVADGAVKSAVLSRARWRGHDLPAQPSGVPTGVLPEQHSKQAYRRD